MSLDINSSLGLPHLTPFNDYILYTFDIVVPDDCFYIQFKTFVRIFSKALNINVSIKACVLLQVLKKVQRSRNENLWLHVACA